MATASCRRALLILSKRSWSDFHRKLEKNSWKVWNSCLKSIFRLALWKNSQHQGNCLSVWSRNNNLDFLEELLTVAQRSDLVEIVKDFKRQPTMEMDSGYPGNYGIINYVYAGLSVSFWVAGCVGKVGVLGGLGARSPRKFWNLDTQKCHFQHFPRGIFL